MNWGNSLFDISNYDSNI